MTTGEPDNSATDGSAPRPGGTGSTSAAMGQTVGRGLSVALLSNAGAKGLAIIAQVVLGLCLTLDDFGLFALTLSVQMFIQTFRDGGVRDYLVTRAQDHDRLIGPCFWLAMTINVIVALGLGIAGHIIAAIYVHGDFGARASDLPLLLWLTAIAVPISTIPSVLLAKLRIDLRFEAIAWMTIVKSLVQYAGSIWMALAGFGVLSLVVPLVIATIVEAVMACVLNRAQPWRSAPNVRMWGPVMKDSGWLIASSAACGVSNFGYYLPAGYFVSSATMGAYYFAVSLLMQVETFLTSALQSTMLPVLVRLRNERERFAEAALRLTRSLVLLCTPLTLGLAAVFPLLDALIWNGKFHTSTLVLIVLAVGYPVRAVMVVVPWSVLQAQGRFKELFFMWLRNGIGMALACLVGALWWRESPLGMAIVVSTFLLSSSILSVVVTLRPFGPRAGVIAWACIKSLSLGVVSMGVALVAEVVIAPMLGRASVWMNLEVVLERPEKWLSFEMLSLVTHAAAIGAVVAGVYAVLVRMLATKDLRDFLSVAPAKLGGLARRVMLLR